MPGKSARAANRQNRAKRGNPVRREDRPHPALGAFVGAIRRGLLAPLPHLRKSTIATF
jgi:hypothetical protein